MFTSLLSQSGTSFANVMICFGVAFALGLVVAIAYILSDREKKFTKNFIISIIILPALVDIIILLVNGNLGAGVAIAGAFSLVRFRSAPGTAKEISAIFITVVIGIATGMGFVAFAAVVCAIVCLIFVILSLIPFGNENSLGRDVRITVPENINFTEAFDDILKKYTSKFELIKVKTSSLGSLYELTYNVILKDPKKEKELIDELRTRNGNLTISSAVAATYTVDSL